MDLQSVEQEEPKLIRQLSLFDTTMIIIGIVIGSGIFLTTGMMANDIPSAPLLLIAWMVGGLHALTGALTYAELGASMPEAGGQYVYLREAYGRFVGFLFGWVSFLVYLTGILAALGIAFAEYFGYFFPTLGTENILFSMDFTIGGRAIHYVLTAGHLVAITLILLLSCVNYFGVLFSKYISNISSVIKIAAILLFIGFGMFSNNTQPIDMTINPNQIDFSILIVGFGIALISVAWTTAGWEEISFIAGEIKDPGRTLPRALILSTGAITILYMLINYIYLSALPISDMAGVARIGEAVSNILFGEVGAAFLAAAVVVAVLGSLNGTILVGPRVYYAMARDGLFFEKAARVHPTYHTPGWAIFIQAGWACVLTLSGTFEDLITFVTFASLMLWIAGAAAVFTLRKKLPDLPRPYKAWGYPYVPIFFIVASLGIMINMLFETPMEAIAGLLLTAIGIPVYYVWRKKLV